MSNMHKGEKNPRWKGDDVGYRSLHIWVENKLGKPIKCKFCGKKGKGRQIHWANKDHKYKRNIKDWIPLCSSCQGKYDKANREKAK